MSDPRGFSLRTAMLAVFLAALGISLVIQGRLLILQGRRIASLEATARRHEIQGIQLANTLIKDQQARIGEFSDLRQEIEALRPVAPTKSTVTPSAKTPQGEWVQMTVERGGNLVNSGERAAKVHLFVDGDVFRSEVDGKLVSQWTIRFDPTKVPSEFDARIENGKFKGQVYRGIYRVEGDRWMYCNGPPGSDRPADFSSPAGSSNTLVVARRKAVP
jgi:uncharacterized protein (TIGR03067 family)